MPPSDALFRMELKGIHRFGADGTGRSAMTAKLRQLLPGTSAPQSRVFLDRLLLSSVALLAVAIASFAVFYYLDHELSGTTSERSSTIDVAAYEQVVRDDPNNITGRLALAEAYFGLQRYNDAIDQYEAALVISDTSALAHVGLGRARLAIGDLAGAAESFQAVVDQSADEDVSGTLVQSAHYYLGKIAVDQARADDAISELETATEMEPTDADAWYLMGIAYVKAGRLADGIQALSKAVMFVPNFAEAYDQLATIYEEQGSVGQALYARAMAAYSRGEIDDAARDLEAAIAHSPLLAEAHTGLGLVRELQGERDAAVVAYQQALHLNPDDFTAKSGLARLMSGDGASGDGLPGGHPKIGEDAGQGGTQP
jgi:tetratricopeptide (TPR) repeat protein